VRSRVVVDLRAIAANLARLRAAHGGDVWAVVKADGYGHGAVPVGGAALAAGAVGLTVATLGEARTLRSAFPDARILVLSPLVPGEEAGVAGIEVAVSSLDGWRRLRAAAPATAVHVKVDTGMGRWGLTPADAIAVGDELAAGVPGLRLAGLMSHLATAEEEDESFARHQVDVFRAVAASFPPCPRHLANSGGALYLPFARADAARCGIALYGISPRDRAPAADGLVPALTWTSEVRATRDLAAGESSGYGRRILASAPLRLALVPVGYADGFPRPAAGGATVLIDGRRATVGAVAMDQLAVVLPDDLDVAAGAIVTIVGRDGGEEATLSGLARAAGTIGYELACGLRHRPDRSAREVSGG
jgi:alanine racemase